ncbi:hypothetical protein [Sediminibacterium goheungense]|uniref:PIN domain-containing protein n=1 Tax=Sediminibacterium goheungense TaxID=1086393 RepID=A0A4R6IW27_9BACT|nr:hypothetical protein [Sediminibacterium goheungense]TDO26557.1 hypothetical protein BC659_1864 [Sediminibacterium goheungense]
MRKISYLQWEHIFLDTSTIFAYMQGSRENNTDSDCAFVKRLIDDLNTNKSTGKQKRNFYISAVSIGEMYDKSTNIKKTESLVKKMNISTMTYVPYDTDVAEHMTSNYHKILGTTKQNSLARTLGFPEHDLVMAREWIIKDLMIIASADYFKCDTVLTIDEKSFLPLCKEVNYYGCLCKPSNFNHNDKYIFDVL